jgi:DNA-binding transcriptional regulator YhcF (GntR family)
VLDAIDITRSPDKQGKTRHCLAETGGVTVSKVAQSTREPPTPMDIQVDKDSDIPLHEQVATQIVFLIGTGKLKPGTILPSVRALARRLAIHRNTISRAYHDLTLNRLVEKRAGRRLAIRSPEPDTFAAARDLDDVVNVAIREAWRRGYSLQQLHDQLRDRLLATPPDRLLVLSDDAGMRRLLPRELRDRFDCPIGACSPEELLSHPERCATALIVSPQGHIPRVRSVLSQGRPALSISYSPADDHVEKLRHLKTPSLIAVASVSSYFLEMALGLLAPAAGRRHSLRGYRMVGKAPARPGAADLVFCDVITYPIMRSRYRVETVFVHRLISEACLDAIASVMPGYSSQRSSAARR